MSTYRSLMIVLAAFLTSQENVHSSTASTTTANVQSTTSSKIRKVTTISQQPTTTGNIFQHEETTVTTTTTNQVHKSSGRIVGGIDVIDPKLYPYYATTGEYGNLCGGTVVHGDVIITAAHCADAWYNSKVVWIGGTHYSHTQPEATVHYIKSIIPHPEYDKKTGKNDIMILMLQKFANVSTYVQLNTNSTIPIPSKQTTVTSIGYGTTYLHGPVSQQLKQTQFNIDTMENCIKYYLKLLGTSNIDSVRHVCNISPSTNDTCNGDSGGPLLVSGTNVQVGIVSYGNGCGTANVPGVNTRISYFVPWIINIICTISIQPPVQIAGSVCSNRNTTNTYPPPVNPICTSNGKFCRRNKQCCSNNCRHRICR